MPEAPANATRRLALKSVSKLAYSPFHQAPADKGIRDGDSGFDVFWWGATAPPTNHSIYVGALTPSPHPSHSKSISDLPII